MTEKISDGVLFWCVWEVGRVYNAVGKVGVAYDDIALGGVF